MIPTGVGPSEVVFYLVPVLVLSLALQAFLIWKVWLGKNWARLTMLAMFLWENIAIWFPHNEAAFPINIPHVGPLKAANTALIVLQAVSFVTLFIKPASEWFQGVSPKASLLYPNG